MLSNILDRISFWSLLGVIVLLPLFFLPFIKIPIETSKGLLVVLGLLVSVVFWLAGRLSLGKIVLPKSGVMVAGLGVVLAFFLSAVFSSAPQVSFFGTMFDMNSFSFIFACFLLMFMSSVVIKESENAKIVLLGILLSFFLVLVFQFFRFYAPEALSFGILNLKTDNILGSWHTLGIFAGFTSIVALFLIEFFSLPRLVKWLLGILIFLSFLLIALVNFSLLWGLLVVFSLLIFIYKISFFSGYQNNTDDNKRFPVLSLSIVIISLLLFLSGQITGSLLPNRLGVVNTEFSPSLEATIEVTKSVLLKEPVLGLGPNRFGEAWAMYKPEKVNTGQFWNIYFESGFGFLPTLASTTGSLGILSLLVFFFLLVKFGIKSIFNNKDNQNRLTLAMFFIAILYLFSSSFFYSVGMVPILLAFAFTGIFLGLAHNTSNQQVTFSLLDNPKKNFISVSFFVLLIIISIIVGYKYIERFLSVPYFGRAVLAQTMPVAESSIKKAISFYSNDLYLRTYSQIYLLKLDSLVNNNSTLSDAEKAELQSSLDQAVNGAVLATNHNSLNYLNFEVLGGVYSKAGSFGVAGANDKAIEAYKTASDLNPLNPGLKLAISRVFFTDGNTKEAKNYANQSLQVKPNYLDALIVLSQIEKSEGNNTQALFYAEKALLLSPLNQDLINYVNSLK